MFKAYSSDNQFQPRASTSVSIPNKSGLILWEMAKHFFAKTYLTRMLVSTNYLFSCLYFSEIPSKENSGRKLFIYAL